MPPHRRSIWWLPWDSAPLLQLLERALRRRLVLAPAHERRAMAEAVAGHMIIADLDHEFGTERLAVGRALGAPAAGAARRIAGEARRLDQALEHPGQLGALATRQGRGETDMVESAGVVVEAEQQRADLPACPLIAKAADDAVRRSDVLHLEHGALAGAVGGVHALGDHPIEIAAGGAEPFPGLLDIGGDRRQAEDGGTGGEVELLESAAALDERLVEQAFTIAAHQAIEKDEARRMLGGKLFHAAGGRVQAHLQRIEGQG